MIEEVKKKINQEIDLTLITFNQKILQITKTGYGKNEKLIGVRTPKLNEIAKKYYKDLTYQELSELLENEIHEYKLFALKVLLLKKKTEEETVVNFYKKHLSLLTNWDLIDISASKILGSFLYKQPDHEVLTYAKSISKEKSFWYRRISVVMFHHFIKNGRIDIVIKHYKTLIKDEEPLIQKALGWMLREIGKQDKSLLISFLQENNCSTICRSYAMEHFSKKEKDLLNQNLKNQKA